MEPEKPENGYLIGTPSAPGADDGGVHLSVRHRRPQDLGRGWISSLSRSETGEDFREIWTVIRQTSTPNPSSDPR